MRSLPLIRTGECNRCGSCCKGDPFGGALGPSRVEGMCPLYDADIGCTDREHPYYLAGCNVWPTRPVEIYEHPECSYRFTHGG